MLRNEFDSEQTDSRPKKVQIAELQPNMTNIELTGIVISKQESRRVENSKTPSKPLYTFNFILRDSEIDFINVNVWSQNSQFMEELIEKMQTCKTAVKIKNFLVKLKMSSNQDDLFKPWTTSQYQLTLNENNCVEILSEEEKNKFEHLLNVPIRDHNDFYTLEDIDLAEKNLANKDVNLLFVIREIKEIEEVNTKNGKALCKLDLIVFDSTKDSLKFTLWDREMIRFALSWTPMHHDTKEGFSLYNFAKTVKLTPIVSPLEKFKLNATKCTIEELKKDIKQDVLKNEFILLNAVITDFDLDSNISKKLLFKCKECNNVIEADAKRCVNRACREKHQELKKSVEINLSISDHTSTLQNVRGNVKVFEKILGLSAEDLLRKTALELTSLKWKVLLERWEILIKVTNEVIENSDKDLIKFYFRIINVNEIQQN